MGLRSMAFNKGRFGKKDFYCNLEDTIYATRINQDEDVDFSYFLAETKVGVGKEGKKEIEEIDIKFYFENIDKNEPKIEIIEVRPNDKATEVGLITGSKKNHFEMSGQAGGGIKIEYLFANASAGGKIAKGKESSEIKTYSYPNNVQIVLSNGAGTNSNWHFKQGSGAGQKGQYELNILFKIRKPFDQMKEGTGTYQIIPTLEINNKKIKYDPNNQEIKPISIYLVTK